MLLPFDLERSPVLSAKTQKIRKTLNVVRVSLQHDSIRHLLMDLLNQLRLKHSLKNIHYLLSGYDETKKKERCFT